MVVTSQRVTMLLDDLARVVSAEDLICILKNDEGNINALLYDWIFRRLESFPMLKRVGSDKCLFGSY